MKLYTKTGDEGKTSVIKGKRVFKSELLIEANGALDEASSYIGWAREEVEDDTVRAMLGDVQHDLYQIMSFFAGVSLSRATLTRRVGAFEKLMDKISAKLPELHRFILPQGGEAATRLHIARTIVRSAERRVVRLAHRKISEGSVAPAKIRADEDLVIIQYLNRLSDLLFVLARRYAQVENIT